MSKSLIYAANNLSQTVAAGDNINFGSIVRRYGCNLNLSGGNVAVSGAGYYDVSVNISATPITAGLMTLKLYKNGVAIPGAEASFTVGADTIYPMSFSAVIRQTCAVDTAITAELSGVGADVTNAAIEVIKL